MSSSEATRESIPLIIERQDEDLSIEISDAFDRVVAAPVAEPARHGGEVQDTSSSPRIELKLPRGLYTVRGTLGGELRETVVRLSNRTTIEAPAPARSTAAAYHGVESSHEYYSAPAADRSRRPTTEVLGKPSAMSRHRRAGCDRSRRPTTEVLGSRSRADSWLFLFLRAWDLEAYASSGGSLENAVSNLHLETPSGKSISLAEHAEIHADGWLAFSAPAAAGDYRLHDLGNPARTTPFTLYPGWQTQGFWAFDQRLLHGTLRVFLSRPNRGFLENDDWARAVDLGLSVLLRGRGTLPGDARRLMLYGKFDNPMLGLIVAWVLLGESETRRDPLARGRARDQLQLVLANLDGMLPGSPDVAALRVANARRYGEAIPEERVSRVPMLYRGAVELIRAVAEHPGVMSGENPLQDISDRLWMDSAYTSWQPLESELPGLLRVAGALVRNPARLFRAVDQSVPEETSESSTRASRTWVGPAAPSAMGEDLGEDWLSEALADVIEQQARHDLAKSASAPLDFSAMAARAGVTPKAVRVALEAAPLQRQQIAMSLSDTPEGTLPEGCTAEQVVDATLTLARSLIAAGASLAYGGDFRGRGFTRLLAELIRTYNQTATRPAQALHSYLVAPIPLGDIPEDLPLVVHHLVHSPDVAVDAILPPPEDSEPHPPPLFFSDMRRVIARHTAARVILGGNSEPRQQAGGPGYGGRYPGVVEEAWRTLEVRKPLYVAGGFGGAAALVADLLEGKETPRELQDATWRGSDYFCQQAAAIDADPYRDPLGLPLRMDDLAQAICDLGLPLLASDAESLHWNGLTRDENLELFRTRNSERLVTLVMRGLLKVLRERE